MTNKAILKAAMKQSAIDSNCAAEDFNSLENKIVLSKNNKAARRYLQLPFLCDFTSYGNNIVASVSADFAKPAKEYMDKFPAEHCFETPNMHWFIEKIKPLNANVCFMAEYFLPDADNFPALKCKFETRVLTKADFNALYLPQWGNALCKDRMHLDKLGVGAYHNGILVGLAACSADCDTMWQIGVDVIPEYRKQGIASSITNQLAHEILKRDIVPFYCCAWSNIKSARNAVKSGFAPAWVQMTIKSNAFVNNMNK